MKRRSRLKVVLHENTSMLFWQYALKYRNPAVKKDFLGLLPLQQKYPASYVKIFLIFPSLAEWFQNFLNVEMWFQYQLRACRVARKTNDSTNTHAKSNHIGSKKFSQLKVWVHNWKIGWLMQKRAPSNSSYLIFRGAASPPGIVYCTKPSSSQ